MYIEDPWNGVTDPKVLAKASEELEGCEKVLTSTS